MLFNLHLSIGGLMYVDAVMSFGLPKISEATLTMYVEAVVIYWRK
jgi:hypothetical protein